MKYNMRLWDKYRVDGWKEGVGGWEDVMWQEATSPVHQPLKTDTNFVDADQNRTNKKSNINRRNKVYCRNVSNELYNCESKMYDSLSIYSFLGVILVVV